MLVIVTTPPGGLLNMDRSSALVFGFTDTTSNAGASCDEGACVKTGNEARPAK
jgi:hypothetical protein